MNRLSKLAVSAALLAGVVLPSAGAIAMPALDKAPAAAAGAVVTDVYWHRGWHGGWHGGWHRGWHGGWHGGWHRGWHRHW